MGPAPLTAFVDTNNNPSKNSPSHRRHRMQASVPFLNINRNSFGHLALFRRWSYSYIYLWSSRHSSCYLNLNHQFNTVAMATEAASVYPSLENRPVQGTICLFDVDGTLTPARRVCHSIRKIPKAVLHQKWRSHFRHGTARANVSSPPDCVAGDASNPLSTSPQVRHWLCAFPTSISVFLRS